MTRADAGRLVPGLLVFPPGFPDSVFHPYTLSSLSSGYSLCTVASRCFSFTHMYTYSRVEHVHGCSIAARARADVQYLKWNLNNTRWPNRPGRRQESGELYEEFKIYSLNRCWTSASLIPSLRFLGGSCAPRVARAGIYDILHVSEVAKLVPVFRASIWHTRRYRSRGQLT